MSDNREDEPGIRKDPEPESQDETDAAPASEEIPLETATTVFPDGFRRVFRFPDQGTLSRARALLLEVASAGGNGTAVSAALGAFPTWESLATICDTPWLAPARHFSNASIRIIRRRLLLLGSMPIVFGNGNSEPEPNGGPVHVRGVCALHPAGRPAAEIWRVTVRADFLGERWVIEEGRDFLLRTPDGVGPLVLSRGAHLAGASVVREGDEVSVFGYLDETPDPTGMARSAHGRGGLALGVRSGTDLPLLVVARNSGTLK